MRGHASIQGSSDIPTLYDLLPGYLPMPRATEGDYTLADYVEAGGQKSGWWSHFDEYIVSLLKAWFGEAATKENDFGFGHLPKLTGNHSHFVTTMRALDGGLDGMFVMGQNPAVGSQHAGLQRRALAKMKWLVVRDLADLETASFWKDSPEIRAGEVRTEDIQTEVFLMPAAGPRGEGRPLHQHAAAAAVARQGAGPAGRRALGAGLHARPRRADQGALRVLRAGAGLADPQPDVGLPRRRGRAAGDQRLRPEDGRSC